MKKNFVLLLILAVLFAEALNAQRNKPIDTDATKETKALYHDLKNYPKIIRSLVTSMLQNMGMVGREMKIVLM